MSCIVAEVKLSVPGTGQPREASDRGRRWKEYAKLDSQSRYKATRTPQPCTALLVVFQTQRTPDREIAAICMHTRKPIGYQTQRETCFFVWTVDWLYGTSRDSEILSLKTRWVLLTPSMHNSGGKEQTQSRAAREKGRWRRFPLSRGGQRKTTMTQRRVKRRRRSLRSQRVRSLQRNRLF